MPKRSKLLQALDDHKGRDYDAERQKKQVKTVEKRKKAKKEKKGEEEGDAVEKKEQEEHDKAGKQNGDASEPKTKSKNSDASKTNEKEDESSDEEQDGEGEGEEDEDEDEDEDEEGDEEDEEDIPLSDLSDEEREDVIPHQRLTINNSAAINTSLKRISFVTPNTPFSEHNSLVSQEPIDVPDPNDDLNRELAFYKVCQAAATTARGLLKKEDIPFTRPGDYFAEMVKTDEHMGKIKKKMYDEAASKKASADARKQRDLKKFGKQVQVSKLQQRQKDKRETLEKIDALKKSGFPIQVRSILIEYNANDYATTERKTNSSGPTDDTNDLFDVAIEDATKPDSRKRGRNDGSGPSLKRQKKNEKFGYGGKKRHAKSGDAISSSDMSGFSVKKMKAGAKTGGPKRPGKSKRAKGRA